VSARDLVLSGIRGRVSTRGPAAAARTGRASKWVGGTRGCSRRQTSSKRKRCCSVRFGMAYRRVERRSSGERSPEALSGRYGPLLRWAARCRPYSSAGDEVCPVTAMAAVFAESGGVVSTTDAPSSGSSPEVRSSSLHRLTRAEVPGRTAGNPRAHAWALRSVKGFTSAVVLGSGRCGHHAAAVGCS
jgi:hypothetical protein